MVRFQWKPALLCALLLALCVVAIWPVAETGIHDDWSYIRTAQVLSQTGHVVYNGWGAPILGIQLLPAALLFKLFGFSFTIARLTTMAVALITTALLQRSMVRCGLNDWNASIATLTLMLSPVCLPVVTGYLGDMWCLLAIVIALYGCLRAVAASSESSSIRWILFAAVGNVLVGTSRQIGWLGLLVMVPSALWLLRHRRRVLKAGAVAYVVGCAVIALTMYWFRRHPYTLPESFHPRGFRHALRNPDIVLRPILEIVLLLLPVLAMFIPRVRQSSRAGRKVAAGAALIVLSGMAFLFHRHTLHTWYAPFNLEVGDLFDATGEYRDWAIWGERPVLLPPWVWAGLALTTLSAALAWIAFTFGKDRKAFFAHESGAAQAGISHQALLTLLLPFTAGYVLFITPRALQNLTIDRYLLPLVMVALLLLTCQYQDRIRPRLPVFSAVLLAAMAVYSVVSLQDAFAAYRTIVKAAGEVTAAGIPRSHFDGGWEFDGLSQIDAGGYVHQGRIRTPPGVPLLFGHRRTGPCEIPIDVWIPDVDVAYALAYTPNGCGGATPFAPVSYRRLYTGKVVTFYVVKSPDLSGISGLFPTYQ